MAEVQGCGTESKALHQPQVTLNGPGHVLARRVARIVVHVPTMRNAASSANEAMRFLLIIALTGFRCFLISPAEHN